MSQEDPLPRGFGGTTSRTLPCGCVMEALFAAACPAARKLEAELRQAIREKDWVGMRAIGARLARHRQELPDAPPAVPLTRAPRPADSDHESAALEAARSAPNRTGGSP